MTPHATTVQAPLPVRLARTPLAAGWVELHAEGIAAEPDAQIVLRVASRATALAVDYAMPATSDDGRLEAVLRLDEPSVGAELLGVRRIAGQASAMLRPVGAIEVFRRVSTADAAAARAALRWRLIGKKVRARNILLRLLGQPRRMAYDAWLARQAEAWATEVQALASRRQAAAQGPRIGVVVVAHAGEAAAPQTLASLAQQLLAPAQLSVCDDMSIATSCDHASADWLLLLPNHHRLAPDAMLRIAAAAQSDPAPAALTWDSDTEDGDGRRHSPELKPQWNEALYLARDYLGAFAVSRAACDAGATAGPPLPQGLPDVLLLHAARSGLGPVCHIPRVLSHRLTDGRAALPTAPYDSQRRALVEAHVRAESPAATAVAMPGGIVRVTFPIPEPAPRISLIVPTRDRLDLTRPCVEGLLHRTAYHDIEVLIADNGSREPGTRAWLAAIATEPRVRVIDCPGPFNFAAINNRAVGEASGSIIGFINNDIAVIGPDWLSEMAGHALRPGIGAVGARLLYESGLVQHAGVLLGVGGYAGHAHRFARPAEWGYLGRLQAQQIYSAVTAACLVVERRKFDAVGGFDAEAFPVAFNDVDLCLRLRAAGWQTFWTPYAELLHRESASRAKDFSPARRAAYDRECTALLARWGDLIADDPCYHPALSRRHESFDLD